MRTDLFRIASELTERGEPFVFAMVVRKQGSHSSVEGDAAIVTGSGEWHGWLGGSCVQPEVTRMAREVLETGEAMMLAFSPQSDRETRPDVRAVPMTCHSGASVDIFLEAMMPPSRLTLFGDSPVIEALSRLGAAMDLAVEVISDPAAPELTPRPEARYVVIATMGENDEGALRRAIELEADYVGVVASKKRYAGVREFMLSQGIDEAALDRVSNPAGLEIGAHKPSEIALAILAEIVQLGAAARVTQRPVESEAQVDAPAQATDPVCSMTVQVEGAQHTAEHDGETFYFCCGGCRERFLAAPEQYLQPENPHQNNPMRTAQ